MTRELKATDIKPAMELATSSTKNLVIAGVNGDEDFPKLLAKYTWTGTFDYNMALIIVAFYAYCMKQGNSNLKKFGVSVRQKGSNSSKLFEYLGKGNGKKVKDCMGQYFKVSLDTVLKIALPDSDDENKKKNEDKRKKIIKSFINRAGKITPWRERANESLINTVIETLADKNNNLTLIDAVKHNDPELVQLLLDKGTRDYNQDRLMGFTALHWAIYKGYAEIVSLLMQNNGPNAQSKYNGTAMQYAILRGNAEMVKLLLQHNKIDLYRTDVFVPNPPLILAINSGNAEMVKLLLHKANPNVIVKRTTPPLHFAINKGNTEIIKLLLDKGADPNIKNKKGDGNAPLHFAINKGDTEIVKLLLDKGADPNIKNKYGDAPLHFAIAKCNTKIVKLLLDKGADPNIKNVLGNPPLFYIPLTYDRRRDRELVELMLQHGATWCPSFYRK